MMRMESVTGGWGCLCENHKCTRGTENRVHLAVMKSKDLGEAIAMPERWAQTMAGPADHVTDLSL